MTQTFHALEICAGDLFGGGLAHCRGGAPVVFAGKEVDRAFLDVDAGDAVSGVEAAEIEVQVAVEDAVGLAGVHVPDQLLVHFWTLWGHHAVDPVRIEQRLIHHGRLIVELPVHGEIVASLERDGAARTDFICADGDGNADLAGHAGTGDDGLVEFEGFDHLPDRAYVCLLVVGVVAWDVIAPGEAPAVSGQIKGDHGALLAHAGVVHDAVVLSTVAAGGVQEHDLLRSSAGRFVEDFRAAPDWSIDVDVFARDVVLIGLGLFVLLQGPVQAIAQKLKQASCEMAVLCEFDLIAVNTDAFLLDVHSLETNEAGIGGLWIRFEELLPLLGLGP